MWYLDTEFWSLRRGFHNPRRWYLFLCLAMPPLNLEQHSTAGFVLATFFPDHVPEKLSF
jgi:hypothetical protein